MPSSSSTSHKPAQSPVVPDWAQVVREKVEKLRFGVVQVVVHEGKVTQIESTERTRFIKPSDI
ncbi:MAG: YezD family protein [Opitutaceae bacterium]